MVAGMLPIFLHLHNVSNVRLFTHSTNSQLIPSAKWLSPKYFSQFSYTVINFHIPFTISVSSHVQTLLRSQHMSTWQLFKLYYTAVLIPCIFTSFPLPQLPQYVKLLSTDSFIFIVRPQYTDWVQWKQEWSGVTYSSSTGVLLRTYQKHFV